MSRNNRFTTPQRPPRVDLGRGYQPKPQGPQGGYQLTGQGAPAKPTPPNKDTAGKK